MQSVLLFLALVAGARASAMEDAFSSNRNEEAERRLTDTPDYDEETCDGVDLHRYDSLEDCCRSVVDHQHELTFFLKTLDTETMAPVCEAKGFTRNGTAPAPVPPTSVPLPAPTSVPVPGPAPVPLPAPTSVPVPGPAPVPLPAPTSLPLPAPTRPAPTSVPLPPPTSVPRPAPTSVPLPYPTNLPTLAVPDKENLLACYSFNDNGGAANPTLTGGSACGGTTCNALSNDATPVVGGGPDGSDHLMFDGTGDVEFQTALTQDITGNADRTICLWAKFDKDDHGGLFSYGDATQSNQDFGLRTRDNPSKFHVQIFLNDPTPFDILAYSPNAWHHYCLTYNSAASPTERLKLYFDGAEIPLEKNGSPYDPYNSQYSGLATASSVFRLGNWNNAFFEGAIDDLCVYKSALSPSEVMGVRALAEPAYPEPPADFPAAGSLAACYHFEGAAPGTPTFVTNNACAPDITKCEGAVSGATVVPGLDNGNALYFNGTDEVVFPTALTQNILGNAPRSIAFWAKFDINDQPSGEGSFFSHGIADTRKDFGFRTRPDSGSNEFHVQIFGDDPDPFDITGYDPNAQNVWHHYCLTYDGDQVKLYFDGDEVLLSVHNPSDLETTSDPFRLGNWIDSDNSNHYFKGAIDDLCVYESALSQPHINELRGFAISAAPTAGPTFQPTNVPTHGPTFEPTTGPTFLPTSSSPTVSLAPTFAPCILDGTEAIVRIREDDDCLVKVWKVTGNLWGLTVGDHFPPGAEVTDVTVTFAGVGTNDLRVGNQGMAIDTTIAGVASINNLYVGSFTGGMATNTNIAAGPVGQNINVGINQGSTGGTAIDTTIAAGPVGQNINVGKSGGTAIDTNVAVGSVAGYLHVGRSGGTATNTNIAAGPVGQNIEVGAYSGATAIDTTIDVAGSVGGHTWVGNQGTATNTNIDVAGSVGNFLQVGYFGGTATNTNIAAGSVGTVWVAHNSGSTATNTTIAAGSVGSNILVGNQGTATNTHITIGAGGFTGSQHFKILVYSGATNTNVFNHGTDPFNIFVDSAAAGTTCNGAVLTSGTKVCNPSS